MTIGMNGRRRGTFSFLASHCVDSRKRRASIRAPQVHCTPVQEEIHPSMITRSQVSPAFQKDTFGIPRRFPPGLESLPRGRTSDETFHDAPSGGGRVENSPRSRKRARGSRATERRRGMGNTVESRKLEENRPPTLGDKHCACLSPYNTPHRLGDNRQRRLRLKSLRRSG